MALKSLRIFAMSWLHKSIQSKAMLAFFSLLVLVASFGLFAVNTNALTLYTLEKTPIDDFNMFAYCKDKVKAVQPDAKEFRLIKVITDTDVNYRCEYLATDGSGYGGFFKNLYVINSNEYCREQYGTFAWATNRGECEYFAAYSNDDLVVLEAGNYTATKIGLDITADGQVFVGSTKISNSYATDFRIKNLGSFSTGEQIVLTVNSVFGGKSYTSASNDPSRSVVTPCGRNCWLVAFETTNNNDFDDFIVRVQKV